MLAIPTFAEGNEILTPTSCTIENKRVYEPLNVTNIYFAGKITVAEDAKALIIKNRVLRLFLSINLFFPKVALISWKFHQVQLVLKVILR